MFPKQTSEEREVTLDVPAGVYRVAFNIELFGMPAASEDETGYVSTVTCKLTVGTTARTFTSIVNEGGDALVHDERFTTFTTASHLIAHCAHVKSFRPGKVSGWAPALTSRIAIDGVIYATPASLR